MRCHPCKPALACWLVAALVLLSCGLAQAQEFDGAWKLTIRKRPTGTTLMPPAVQGAIIGQAGDGSGKAPTYRREAEKAGRPLDITFIWSGSRAVRDPAGIDPFALVAQGGARDLTGVRIGVGDPFLWRDCDAGIAEAVQEAVDTLVRAGAVARDFTLPESEAAYGVFLDGGLSAIDMVTNVIAKPVAAPTRSGPAASATMVTHSPW